MNNVQKNIKAPHGTKLSCKGWHQEAAMRMLMNNLDPDVAEKPDELIVYGGGGKAARNWESYHRIIKTLQRLENDETLMVQSGKPVGVFRTHEEAPRVLIANAHLVPKWANWDEFRKLDKMGLTMYGQMTAGSWIYISTQGILQGTYETFAECARQHFEGSLAGTLNVTAGCGGMGGAQPLAITMNGGTCLIADVDESRLRRRMGKRYLDRVLLDIDSAIDCALELKAQRSGISVGVVANAVDLLERIIERGIVPDTLTDQTSAHDPLKGYVPAGYDFEQANAYRSRDPDGYVRDSLATMRRHVEAMVTLQDAGSVTFDYGNNIRQRAFDEGLERAFDFPGFVPAFIRPQFCVGRGPFRWCALSGNPEDIYRTDQALLEAFPEHEGLARWLTLARERIEFEGLPARICWLGQGERARAGRIFNDLVRNGEVEAPIVIGRDHLDCGSVASPNRETEGMADGSDAISDWAILNALVNTASGASWVSFHHGGGVGIGYSQHAGQVIVADGTDAAERRLERVLTNDPAMGVFRHVSAGYDEARACAEEQGLDLPFDRRALED